MVAKTGKTKPRRPSKGQRTHIRRMKQAARKDGTIYSSLIKRRAPARIDGE